MRFKARYEDDYRKYENSLEELFSVSPESLCIFHLNLTKNLITEEHGTSPFVKALLRGNGVDELFRNIAGIITDQEDAAHFSEIFNRQHLLEEFSRMHPQILLKYHRMIDEKESHLVKTSLSMLKNPDGGDIEAIVYSSDIDRQEKEEQVISAITNREYDYIALIDAKTEKINYQYTSRKAADSVYFRMGNYNESMKEAIAQMYVPEERGHYYEQISFGKVLEALSRQEEYSYIFSCNDTAGQSRQKKISFRYLDEKKREILFFRSDITEEMRQEREQSDRLRTALNEAQHANAMKTEFLSNVSHDMRTPLNAVIGYTDLARKTEDPAVQTAYLDKIDKAGKILLSLINDTLDLSKIENGIITLKPVPVSCDEVVKKVVSSVKPAMDEKRIHFVLDNSRAVMAEIRVDPLRLQEIFINLLSNAVKFTPEEGRVELIIECVRLEDRCVHDKITVRDTGCGMSSDFLPKIFEPFTQERQAATADVGGSGLGLSIVKKLVDMMDGRIEVQSELGKGSAFTVWLDFERTDSRTSSRAARKRHLKICRAAIFSSWKTTR